MSSLRSEDGASADMAVFGTYAPSPRLARIIARTRALPDTWLGRRVAYAWRRLALSRISEPVDAESVGARFRLYPRDNVAEKRLLFTPQYFDAAERAMLAEAVRAAGPGFVFVDIGANVGGYALAVAVLAGAGAQVLAVEPQPAVFERLCDNIRLNPGRAVKAVDCAVADLDGEVRLFIDRANRGETGVRYVRQGGGDAGVPVPAKTLMSLLREEGIARLDAVKLDVEGAEDLILEPFFAAAPQSLWPRMIVIEDGRRSWQVDLLALFTRCGYRRRAATKRNFVYVRD